MGSKAPVLFGIDRHSLHGRQSVYEPVPYRKELLLYLIKFLIIELCRKAHACYSGHIFSAGAHIPFLPSAKYQGMEMYPFIYEDKSGSLGSVYLMGAH